MNNLFRILNLFLLLNLFLNLNAQTNENGKIKVDESINLKTDRNLYFSGEEIYFTADYFINKNKTYPLLSNVIYLELIDIKDNSSVTQHKYKINDFNITGKLNIPRDISSGNYMLRAYTQYQRNFSSLDFSYLFLTIINPNSSPLPSNQSYNIDSIYIVPEGGILLKNSLNKVLIGIPESLINKKSIYQITDESNNTVKELDFPKQGILEVEMTFNELKQYKFVITKNFGDKISQKLPVVFKNGIKTTIESRTDNNFNYKIQIQGSASSSTKYLVKILSNDLETKYRKEIILNGNSYDLIISNNDFYNGINYILLTDENENIKRINSIYKTPEQTHLIEIETSKLSYKPNETIDASLIINDIPQEELLDVSVSVTRNGTKKEDYCFNPTLDLRHPLLLENFFNSNPDLTNEFQSQIMVLFDNVFNIESFIKSNELKKSTELEYIPEIRDLTISGILRNKKTKEPIPNHNLYLSVLSNNPQLHIYTTRENGNFIFSLNNVYGTNEVFLCAETYTEEQNDYEILIKSTFSSDIPELGNIPVFINETNLELLNEIYVNSKIKRKFSKNEVDIKNTETKISFNLNDNKLTVLPDNFVKLETMQELLYEIVPNIIVKKNDDKFYFKILDENNYMLQGTPLILVDNIPVFDPNKVMSLNPAQITKIEVIYKSYILGSHSINGIVMFSTNTENFAEIELPKSSTFISYQTLEEQTPNTEFSINKVENNIPDFRTTLFWDPFVTIKDNETKFQFTTSDRKGSYDIVVKGFNSSGEVFYGKKQIKVE